MFPQAALPADGAAGVIGRCDGSECLGSVGRWKAPLLTPNDTSLVTSLLW